MRKYAFLLLLVAISMLTGCAVTEFFTPGLAGEPSDFEGIAGSSWLSYATGGLSLVLAKTISSGVRFKRAIFEATDSAISSGGLSSAETKKEVKEALAEGQALHNDSKILAKEYKKFREGGFLSKTLGMIKNVLMFWKK